MLGVMYLCIILTDSNRGRVIKLIVVIFFHLNTDIFLLTSINNI